MALKPFDARYLTIGGTDSFIKTFDRRFLGKEATPTYTFCPNHISGRHSSPVTSLRYNHDGSEFVVRMTLPPPFPFFVNPPNLNHHRSPTVARKFTE